MADFELLAPGGHQKLVDEVVDRLDLKADIDGYYAQLTAGAADNLTARGDAVEASFIRRTSGGIADIESGNATIKSIKGNTVRWNQLVPQRTATQSDFGVTAVIALDGSVTFNGTATATGGFGGYSNIIQLVNGHIYLMKSGGDLTTPAFGSAPIGWDTGSGKRFTYSGSTGTTWLGFLVNNETVYTNVTIHPQLFDLTQMFGAGNEPETVAEFEALYPEPYYPYDAGSLLPVTMTGIATDGFNQWDEEWEQGALNHTTGEKMANISTIRSKNFIPVFPSTEYCANVPGSFAAPHYYDADKNYIGYELLNRAVNTFTTPANCRYIRFNTSITYGATYKGDICINLSWSGRRNGEYEPYWSAQRAIDISTYFPTGLKKAGSAFDELTATEAIQRVGVVDLGSLTWIVAATGSTGQYRMVSNGLRSLALKPASNAVLADITCQKYDVHTSTEVYQLNVGICIDATGDIVVYDPNYATQDSAAAFKTAMSGVTLYYALATPTTTAIDQALNLTYKVDDWGTETITGPLGAAPDMDIIYGMNAVDTIRRLPDLYAGKAETEAALAGKADVDGYYSQMTVGAADNLTGRGDTTTAEFLYRTAGGTADIETGQAVAKSIKGNTLVWNQLTSSAKPASDNTVNGVTITNNHDGTFTLNGTASAATIFNIGDVTVGTSNHKILIKGCPSGGTADKYRLKDGYGTNSDLGSGVIDQVPNNNTIAQIIIASGYTCDNLVFTPQLFDLTQMFGAGNEPSTVAEFEALFPQPYYEYDAGSLLSVSMTGIETVGFNQWDEEWEVGEISDRTGQNSSGGGRIRAKNFIPCFANTSYYLRSSLSTDDLRLYYYDAGKGYIGHTGWLTNGAITTPTGCHYMRFATGGAYGATYKGDICINLSWSGRRNGEYEPFWSSQRLIDVATYFPDGMRSTGSVYDELTSTEAIQRVGVVDLGTLNWKPVGESGRAETTDKFVSDVAISGKTNMSIPDIATDAPYTARNYYGGSSSAYDIDKSISIGYLSGGVLLIHDTDFANKSATEVKAALAGKTLYYALATPTVTPIDPALNLSYRVDDFGTERVMVPEDERSAPPVLDIAYGLNVVDFVRRAPSEYISAASFRQYLLARDAHDGTTTTMTWDDTDNRYEFAITDTVTEG